MTEPSDPAERARQYDPDATRELLFHLDRLFHERVNAMLVVEALLAVSVALIWRRADVRLALALFSFVLTLLLTIANLNLWRKLTWTMDQWRAVEASGLFRDYSAQAIRIAGRRLPRSIHLFAWWIPLLILVAWLLVAISAIVGR